MRTSVSMLLFTLSACSSSSSTSDSPSCTRDAECGASAPLCSPTTHACVALPAGHEVGYRDGTSTSVTLTEIYTAPAGAKLVDVDFDPDHDGWLWAVGYGDDAAYVGQGIGSEAPEWHRYVDPAHMHFMHKPPALAMGGGLRWATCGDNDNGQNGGGDLFMGPALFETDLSVFAKRTPDGRGSHTDMLHASPLCRGIAHETKLVYWVFNAYDGAIDKYDFGKEHEPGGDDHSAGSIYRYVAGQVKGKDGVASHVAFDAADGSVYVADTGHARVVRLDPTSATRGEPLPRQLEPLADDAVMEGATLDEIVPPGVLDTPSGIEVHGDLLFVTDAATSTFHVFDKTGNEVRSLATDLPPGSLSGFTFGPDGKIYFADAVTSRIVRIDPL